MRFAGAFVLAVLLVAVAETRPQREKRGIKICSARDVKFMATFVCNLHKRSVRSVDAADFGNLPEETEGLLAYGSENNIPRRTLCNENGEDCGHQIDGSNSAALNQLSYIHAWLAENGYAPLTSAYRNQPGRTTENGKQLFGENGNQLMGENGSGREDLLKMIEALGLVRQNSMAKRDKEVDWPIVPSMTLGDIRKNCCLRHCRVEDFYGACS